MIFVKALRNLNFEMKIWQIQRGTGNQKKVYIQLFILESHQVPFCSSKYLFSSQSHFLLQIWGFIRFACYVAKRPVWFQTCLGREVPESRWAQCIGGASCPGSEAGSASLAARLYWCTGEASNQTCLVPHQHRICAEMLG